MQIFLIISLLIAALATIFAVQNADVITITFLFWEFQGSLALVLLVALAAGALTSFFASLPSLIRKKLTVNNQKKKIKDLEAQLTKQEQKLPEAIDQSPDQQPAK